MFLNSLLIGKLDFCSFCAHSCMIICSGSRGSQAANNSSLPRGAEFYGNL